MTNNFPVADDANLDVVPAPATEQGYIAEQSTVEPNNGDSQVIFSLFTVLNELGYLDESLSLINKLVTDFPKRAKYYYARAETHRLQGQVLHSIAGFKSAIQLLHTDIKERPETVIFKRLVPHMVVEDAAIALSDLKVFLDANDIPFFLVDGTLLGLHRDGELLPYDKDMDIGLPWNIPRLELVDLVAQSKNFYIPEKELAAENFDWNISVTHRVNGIAIDFFFFKPEGEFFDCGLHHLPNPLLWRFSAFKTKLIQYRGNDYAVPENPEQYLLEVYGPNWKTPDPYFDSLVTGHNLTAESKFISLAYAYARLYNQLNRAYWNKAFGYCQQIFAYEKESWLVELAQWLEVKMNEHPQETPHAD